MNTQITLQRAASEYRHPVPRQILRIQRDDCRPGDPTRRDRRFLLVAVVRVTASQPMEVRTISGRWRHRVVWRYRLSIAFALRARRVGSPGLQSARRSGVWAGALVVSAFLCKCIFRDRLVRYCGVAYDLTPVFLSFPSRRCRPSRFTLEWSDLHSLVSVWTRSNAIHDPKMNKIKNAGFKVA